MLTYFVVQSFEKTPKGAITPNSPVQVQGEPQALRMAERLSLTAAAVVAFSRTGDPSTGEFEDAVILASYGNVPGLEQDLAIAS